jgi:hypothetical protein
MSTQTVEPKIQPSASLVQIGSVEDIIQSRLAEERARLEREAGVAKREVHHFKRPAERPFTREQRARTTLLFGGLTWKHEKLVHGALEGLGYIAEAVPTPNVRAFQTGKEYGNNGQCNPTYFTVGNLVQYLQNLEEQGLAKQEIIDRYVFFTAGACGPCRFGMYEAEYRLALRNAGFDGFRVLLFQQSGGLSQSDAEAGLEMNLDFFLGILNALNCGDVMNEVAYAIRPYEVQAGASDAVLDGAMDYLHEVFRKKRPWKLDENLSKFLGGFSDTAEYLGKFVKQVKGDDYVPALNHCRDLFNEVDIDRLRVKPIVKITGEFWAQTTEGDGNFHMFRIPGTGRRPSSGRADRHLGGIYMMSPGHPEVRMTLSASGRSRDRTAAPKWYEAQNHLAKIELVLPQEACQASRWPKPSVKYRLSTIA